MKNCATCKFMGAERGEAFFADDDADSLTQSAHHSCVRIIHGNRHGDSGLRATMNEPAIVTDGSGYAARLMVLPTFGCVLHEESDPAEKVDDAQARIEANHGETFRKLAGGEARI